VFNLQKQDTLDRFKSNYDFSFILWFYPFSQDPEHLRKADYFDEVAAELRHTPWYFGRAARADLRDNERIKFGEMPVVRMYGIDEAYDYNVTNFSKESLRKFIDDHKFSHVFPLDDVKWNIIHRDLEGSNKVMLLSFVDLNKQEQLSKYVTSLRVLAWDYRISKNYNFQMAYLDLPTYPELAAKYGVHETPALVAVDFRTGKVTQKPEGLELDVRVDTLRWLKDLWAGKEHKLPAKQAKP
jgi:hypothetical protein